MPKYTVNMETKVVKQATVRDIEAPNVTAAIEQARQRIRKNDVDWGNAEVGEEIVNVEEQS